MAGDQKQCFVIGVIGDDGSPERTHADWLYDGIVLPVFEPLKDWAVERADKIATPGMVSSQIINRLHDVELVIADLSFHNANAFYEMSIRHKVAKPIIHMIRKGEKIPFDVIPHRAIHFAYAHPNDLKEAREKLSLAVAEAIEPGFEADNPIIHARGKLEFEQHASPAMKVLADELAALRSRVDSMEAAQQNSARVGSPGLWSSATLGLSPESATLGLSPEIQRLVTALSRPSILGQVRTQPTTSPPDSPPNATHKSE